MKTTVLLSANTSWYLHNFRSGFIRKLISIVDQVIIVAPSDEYSANLQKFGCVVCPVTIKNKQISPVSDVLLLFSYLRIFFRKKPSIILSFTVKPVIYGSLAARLLRIPCINTITGLGSTFIYPSMVTTVVKILYRLSLGHSHSVIFQNQVDKSFFLNKSLVKTKQAELVPGSGVNLNFFCRTKLEVKLNFCFLMVARILKDKGVIEYLECAKRLGEKNVGIRFQLVGAVELSNHFGSIDRGKIDSYHEKKIIEYTEKVDDIRPFIGGSDCVVLPSYREGLSRILLEAAAMGRPIITSDVPGCREVVVQQRNGILCQAGSVESLETAMWEMFETSHEDRVTMGTESRAIAVERFDEDIVINKYLMAIRACVNR